MLEYFVLAYCAGYKMESYEKSVASDSENTGLEKRKTLAKAILSKIKDKLRFKQNTKERGTLRNYDSPVLIAVHENFYSPKWDTKEDPLIIYCQKENQDMEEVKIEEIGNNGINPRYEMEFLVSLKDWIESRGQGCPESIVNCLHRLFAFLQTGNTKI